MDGWEGADWRLWGAGREEGRGIGLEQDKAKDKESMERGVLVPKPVCAPV